MLKLCCYEFRLNLIMFGFQAFAKGIFRAATRCSVSQFSTAKPLALNWSFKSFATNIDNQQASFQDVLPFQDQG